MIRAAGIEGKIEIRKLEADNLQQELEKLGVKSSKNFKRNSLLKI